MIREIRTIAAIVLIVAFLFAAFGCAAEETANAPEFNGEPSVDTSAVVTDTAQKPEENLGEVHEVISDASDENAASDETQDAIASEQSDVELTEAVSDDTEETQPEQQPEETGGWRLIKRTEYDDGGNVISFDEYEYNDHGDMTMSKSKDVDGSFERCEYAYNDNWERISETDYDTRNKMVKRYDYEYDADGNRIRYKSTDASGIVYLTENEYDENGKRIRSKFYSNGTLSSIDEFEFDENGNEIKDVSLDAEGNMMLYFVTEYDENGNKISFARYNADGKKQDRWYRCEYDAAGNMILEIDYNGSVASRYQCEYDTNGNLICDCFYNIKGVLEYRNEHEYDANGNEIKYTRYNRDGKILKQIEYAYDENGNKITETVFSAYEDEENRRIEYEWAHFENAPKTGKYNVY